jgi:predicted dehydrogenase
LSNCHRIIGKLLNELDWTNIQPTAVSPDYESMFASQKNLPVKERMHCVAIVTPNNTHYDIASLALESGFHVLCEKPATFNVEQARELKKSVEESGRVFALAHTYTGYPMLKEARQRVLAGQLGKIRKVFVDYTQGWLAPIMQAEDTKQASWRLDPQQAGASCCMGDIGSHCANLAEFVTGAKLDEVLACLQHEPSRKLDDDGAVMLRFDNGATGIIVASQICVGEENNLRIRVYGEKGGLEWQQLEPNTLTMKWPDRPSESLRAGQGYLHAQARHYMRTPPGHPEGYIEAFANVYRAFATKVRQAESLDIAEYNSEFSEDLPDIQSALRGMQFIEATVRSSHNNNTWVKLE